MTVEILLLKEIGLLPELFLGITLIYLLMHGTFLSVSKNYPLIQVSVLYLSILILSMTCFLFINDSISLIELSIFNNSIAIDYLGFLSKIIIGCISIFCILMIQQYLIDQKINNFEYILLLLLAILGLFLICSSNDLITAYLAIELQSLAFYLLASYKKNSTFSVDAGLKYFILGSFSSSLFLFGASIIYGITGSTNLEDFKDLFFWVFPGSIAIMSDLNLYYSNQNQNTLLESMINKLKTYKTRFLLKQDVMTLFTEFDNIENKLKDEEKGILYTQLLSEISKKQYLSKDEVFSRILPNNCSECYSTNYKDLAEANFLHKIKVWLHVLQNSVEYKIKNMNPKDTPLLFFWPSCVIDPNEYVIGTRFYNIIAKIPVFFWLNDFQDENYFFKPFDINLLQLALIFILISLFFKLALAPFHLWSPDVYEGSPSSSTFFFAVIPKLGIFILLLRIFFYGFYGFIDNWRYYIVIISVLSIIIGSFVGVEQRKLKSLLAYSAISHMGYSLIAFSTGTFEGIQMLLCYLIVYMFSGLCIWSIFLITRLKTNYLNKQNKDLADLSLLNKSNSMLAGFFSVALLSIAGLPPMVGFFVKLGVFLVSIESSLYFVALISILCSVISTFFYIRIVKVIYFEKCIAGKLYYPITTEKSIIIVLFFYLLIFLFINPTLLYLISYKASLLFFI